MERVGENHVAEHSVGPIIRDIERGIELQIEGEVPGEPECRSVTRPALKIHLSAERFVEVVGITENRFIPKPGVDEADDEFVVLLIIPRLDVRLRIDPLLRRPIYEANREEVRLFPKQAYFCRKDEFLGIESFEYRNLAPRSQSEL